MDDDVVSLCFQLPRIVQADVKPVGDRRADLRDVRAQINQAPQQAEIVGAGEGFDLFAGGHFEIQFPGDLRDGRSESLGDVFRSERRRRQFRFRVDGGGLMTVGVDQRCQSANASNGDTDCGVKAG